MQMIDTFSLIQILLQALPLVFGFALLLYLGTRRREYPRPIGLAMMAIGLLMFTQLGSAVATAMVARNFGVDQIAVGFSAVSAVSAILHATAVLLLIRAVFIDRNRVVGSTYFDTGGTPLANQPSDNPYAGPRQ